MRRVLAVVGAVAMIVGALVVRGRLDDGKVEDGQVYRLVCAADLGRVCDELRSAYEGRVDITVESAGTTANRLRSVDGDPGLDGWLVADPWPAIVDGGRGAAALGPVFAPGPPAPLARSPLVIVAWKDRTTPLAATCEGGVVGWKCIGEAAGRPDAKAGHADAADDGIGLLVLGQATAAWFGRADLSTFDLDDDGFQRWFGGLERAMPPSPRSPLERMLTIGRAAYDFVGTTEADATQVDKAARRNELTKLYPSPMATADVVLAVTPGTAGGRLRDLVGGRARDELIDTGWKAPGATGLPADNGLPSPGLLDALRSRAREVTGR